jgi:hypothetical protein
VTFKFTPPPEPAPELGDYNGNGYPDASDYTVWRDTKGSTTDMRADGNGDHVIDQNDYNLWKSAFTNRLPVGIQNGNFSTGDLSNWKKVITANGDVSAGFPRVESFDVDGDGIADAAMRIRVGQVTFTPGTPAGGGIDQKFILEVGGDYTLSANYASTNSDTGGNTGPGKYELLLDGVILASKDLNGTLINPGQVLRGSLSGSAFHLGPGVHDVEVLYLRAATNSREIYGYVDNIRLLLSSGSAAQVPEPGTLLMSLLGALAVLSWRRGA